MNGQLKPKQLAARLDKEQLIELAQKLIDLIYAYSAKDLPGVVDDFLTQLPGGEEWYSD